MLDERPAQSRGTHEVRRSRWMWMTAGACVLLTAGGFVAGSFVRSPWDDAAANSQAQVVATARVEQREFAAQVVEAQGTVAVGVTRDVTVAAGGATVQVVTGSRAKVGDVLHPGDALVEVSGRPLIALGLPFDLYRDIRRGDSGADVRELQNTLRLLGLYSLPSDGEYGPATAAAVRALYEAVGAPAPSAAPDLVAAVGAAEEALDQAEHAHASADGTALPQDSDEVRQAQETLAQARGAADTPVPMAEVVALPDGVASVVRVAPVGARLDTGNGAVASLRSGQTSATVRVAVADKGSFPVGAQIDVAATADQTTSSVATVSRLSEFKPADDTTDIPGYDATLIFGDTDPPFDDGAQIVARIDSSAATQRGLSVPLVSVRDDGDGTYVLIPGAEAPTRVGVEVLMTADGYALIDADLTVGAEVIVGGTS